MWALLSRYLVFCHFLFLSLQVICSSLSLNPSSSPSAEHCSPGEAFALLLFKNSFATTNGSATCVKGSGVSYPKTNSWNEGSDCCSWDGVTCDWLTGHVIELDLSCSQLHGSLHPNSSLFLLHHLHSLNLACNDFFHSKISSNFSQLTKLTFLDLSFSNFEGSIPASFWNLTRITYLSLGYNSLTGQVPASLSNFGNLTHLDLGYNGFSGPFPDVFGNLSKLGELYLSRNNFTGQLPSSTFNLTQLSILDFSRNLFEGRFPSLVSGLSHLTQLLVFDNLISGSIPSWLFSLPSLEALDLSNNKFYALRNSTIESVHIRWIDLSSNNLCGVISPELFSKSKNLFEIDLSHNSRLSLKANSSVNSTLPMLLSFKMSSCSITEFPIFLRASENLTVLDLSGNKISGQISKRELKQWGSLQDLNLAHNFVTSIEEIPLTTLLSLDLQSNFIEKLIDLPPDIGYVYFSNNRLTGEIPPSFCSLKNINILNLSNNSLSGIIPKCLLSNSTLTYLDLRMNKLHGSIDQTCQSMGSMVNLNLNRNQLEGSLPVSLVNCTLLEVLDVGNNKINDTFPHWLGVLPNLQVLILRSNKFHGSIHEPRSIGISFPELRVLDLSHNRFNGLLPTRIFENFEAMMHGSNISFKPEYNDKGTFGYYHYAVVLTVKGFEVEMERTLDIFTTIDFSNNQFQGQIPEIVGRLNSLIVLNFSFNSLTGHIPSLLKNLTQLESLDLSSNELTGKIPPQLTSLTFLSVLNLSRNQLVGPIPQGNQFETFQSNSYDGNLGLCGLPLSKKCGNDEAPVPTATPTTFPEECHTSSWFDWKVIMMGYGSGLVIGLSMGYIVFSTRKPWWVVRLVERGQLKIEGRLNGRRGGRRH